MGTALTRRLSTKAMILVGLLWLAFAPLAGAQPDVKVSRVIWGFTGSALVEEYQPVSILVENRGDEPFLGSLEFVQVELTQRIGLPQVSPPAPIAPGGQRWLQFMARPREWDAFELKHGLLSSEEVPLVTGQAGYRAARIRPESSQARTLAIPDFPDRLLPRSVVAYGTLDHLVIDLPIELDALQQTAVRDWVFDGGALHLFSDGNGGYPELPGRLASLSPGRSGAEAGPTSFGAGCVVLHPMTGSAATWTHIVEGLDRPLSTPPRSTPQGDAKVFSKLAEITSPHHQFGWIYGLVALLFLVIGPVNFMVARRVRNYGISLLVTTVAIVGFSAAFYWIGKAGQRGLAGRYVATYARALEDGYRYRQLDHLFVSSGGRYDLRPQGDAAYHQLGMARQEKVDGLIYPGVGGLISLNMPLYSSRQVIAESTVRQPWVVAPSDRGSEELVVPEVEGREVLWILRSYGFRTQSFRAADPGLWRVEFDAVEKPPRNVSFPESAYGSPSHRRAVFEEFARDVMDSVRGAHREHIFIFARETGAVPTQSSLDVAEQYVLYHHIVTEDRPR